MHYRTFLAAAAGICLASCHTQTAATSQPTKSIGTVATASLVPIAAAPAEQPVFKLDPQDRKVMEKTSPRTVDRMDRNEPLTVNDIIKLSQGGVNDDSIISYMQQNNSTYNLSQAQVRRLQDAGVSQRVINFMIDSGR